MVQYSTYQPRGARPSARSRSEGPRFKKFVIFITFLIAAGAVIFVLLKVIRHEIVIIPSTATYDSSLTNEEKSSLENIFSEQKLAHDVTISAESDTTYTKSASYDTLLYDILIPVTGFYNPKQDITATEAKSLSLVAPEQIEPEDEKVYLLSINKLTPDVKALSIDGDYALDIISTEDKSLVGNTYKGAIFRILHFQSNDTTEAHDLIAEKMAKLPDETMILSLNQTGVTALARAMLNKLNQVGDGAYFAEQIADFLKRTDYTHISNEVSFANDCTNSSSTALCSSPKMFETIQAIGTDIVELTGNHNNDWGTADNIASIEKYHANDMQTFGGGINEEEAKKPLELSKKGTNITLLGINESTSTKANGQGASGDHPGANIYDETTTRAQIKTAKDRGDIVIVDIQYFECYCYPDDGEEMPSCDYPINGQAEFFRSIIDMGADIVIGTQAHQPQTYEIYNGKFIYYGTGNLFFDQVYWPGTERSLVFSHYFYNGKLLQTRLTPTVYDRTFQTRVMTIPEAENFLTRLVKASSKGE